MADPVFLSTIGLIVLAASFTLGTAGFGFGMVCMSLLPLVLTPQEAVPLVAVFGLLTNLGLLIEVRAWRTWRDTVPLCAGGVVGIPLGVAFLQGVDPAGFYLSLGIVILGWVLAKPVSETTESPGRLGGVLAGLFGGALGGAFNSGGPVAVAWVGSRGWDPARAKGALQVFFLQTTLMQILLFGANGMLTPSLLKLNLMFTPVALLGMLVGARSSARLDRDRFQLVLRVLLGVLALNFLRQGALGLMA